MYYLESDEEKYQESIKNKINLDAYDTPSPEGNKRRITRLIKGVAIGAAGGATLKYLGKNSGALRSGMHELGGKIKSGIEGLKGYASKLKSHIDEGALGKAKEGLKDIDKSHSNYVKDIVDKGKREASNATGRSGKLKIAKEVEENLKKTNQSTHNVKKAKTNNYRINRTKSDEYDAIHNTMKHEGSSIKSNKASYKELRGKHRKGLTKAAVPGAALGAGAATLINRADAKKEKSNQMSEPTIREAYEFGLMSSISGLASKAKNAIKTHGVGGALKKVAKDNRWRVKDTAHKVSSFLTPGMSSINSMPMSEDNIGKHIHAKHNYKWSSDKTSHYHLEQNRIVEGMTPHEYAHHLNNSEFGKEITKYHKTTKGGKPLSAKDKKIAAHYYKNGPYAKLPNKLEDMMGVNYLIGLGEAAINGY